jgi:tRNA threonylcarbamoyladenosine biosynthesis protein TsaE
LGGGKTTFVRGLARGIGSKDRVASPTFTISRVYQAADDKQLHHFDFYRLNEAGIIAAELAEVVDDPDNVTVIEWGEIVHNVLPAKRLTIEITRTGDDTRTISVNYPDSLEYLVRAMQQ